MTSIENDNTIEMCCTDSTFRILIKSPKGRQDVARHLYLTEAAHQSLTIFDKLGPGFASLLRDVGKTVRSLDDGDQTLLTSLPA